MDAEVIINFWYFDIATLYVRRPYMSDDPICQTTLYVRWPYLSGTVTNAVHAVTILWMIENNTLWLKYTDTGTQMERWSCRHVYNMHF